MFSSVAFYSILFYADHNYTLFMQFHSARLHSILFYPIVYPFLFISQLDFPLAIYLSRYRSNLRCYTEVATLGLAHESPNDLKYGSQRDGVFTYMNNGR